MTFHNCSIFHFIESKQVQCLNSVFSLQGAS
ncbi:unnamed protein product [Oikopleura dioica]|uniref:Uncharacterized protein n=1 Tax=Oikopleura dioica TaxID=34765 RepID=E4WQS2_OIKDI|nr:unnamed protein product [Oikopleura dioica]